MNTAPDPRQSGSPTEQPSTPGERGASIGPYGIGPGQKLLLLAGPCVIESREGALGIARQLVEIGDRTGVQIVFKASFDKANRSSIHSFRGPGMEDGLAILAEVKRETGLPLVTDIHEATQAAPVAEVVDLLQIPAFLCRQTDLLVAAARTGRAMNVKKGQFLAPWDMENVVCKVREAGGTNLTLTERGASFGYNTLVSDMRAIPQMQKLGVPVIFDATHSTQQPGGSGTTTGGDRKMAPYLAMAAMAVGCDGFFMEVHPDPERGLSDASNMLPIAELEPLLGRLLAIREAAGWAGAELR